MTVHYGIGGLRSMKLYDYEKEHLNRVREGLAECMVPSVTGLLPMKLMPRRNGTTILQRIITHIRTSMRRASEYSITPLRA